MLAPSTMADRPKSQVPSLATEHPNLGSAPIREALIDFRVRLGREVDLEVLGGLADSLTDDYPNRTPIHQFHGQIGFNEHGVVAKQEGGGQYGHRITSANGLNVAQLCLDGFTFSRLKPYQSWGSMVGAAWSIWERYVDVLRPLGVARVATRFINVLRLPPRTALDRFLTAPPKMPPGLPTTCSAFLFRYVTEATGDTAAIVSLATEPSPDPQSVSVVLDIDCYAHRDFSVTGGGVAGMTRTLDELRNRKNEIFFRSVTPEALEMWR